MDLAIVLVSGHDTKVAAVFTGGGAQDRARAYAKQKTSEAKSAFDQKWSQYFDWREAQDLPGEGATEEDWEAWNLRKEAELQRLGEELNAPWEDEDYVPRYYVAKGEPLLNP